MQTQSANQTPGSLKKAATLGGGCCNRATLTRKNFNLLLRLTQKIRQPSKAVTVTVTFLPSLTLS